MASTEIALFLRHLPEPGVLTLPALGLSLLHSHSQQAPSNAWHEPSLVYVLQGSKHGQLGGQRFAVGAGEVLLIHLPQVMSCETSLIQDQPFLALALSIDMNLVAELLLTATTLNEPPTREPGDQAVAPQSEADKLALARLLSTLSDPVDQQVLGPALSRELHYHALCSAVGGMLRQMVNEGSKVWVLWRVVQAMRANLSHTPEMGQLAKQAAMSESAFFAAFKRQLGSSPLQYLKQLRLQKARQLMGVQGFGVAQAAFAVGYASASQFSREYRQFFGHPPSEAARWL